MAKLRYVKSTEELAQARAMQADFTPLSESLEAVYETDPAIVAAVLPPPLVPAERPLVRANISWVDLGPAGEIGAAVFGVDCRYGDREGHYPITMPMSTEPIVVGGRERFGEPKKLADISFKRDGDSLEAGVARYGITYMEISGRVVETLEPTPHSQDNFYLKVFPAADGKGFEGDPLLVGVRYEWEQPKVERLDGDLVLREAPLDPVADLPINDLISIHYYHRQGGYKAEILGPLEPAGIAPFVHQRYDDFAAMAG